MSGNTEIKEGNPSLKDLLVVAEKYYSGEWDDSKIDEYISTLNIKNYISIMDKVFLSSQIVNNFMYEDTEIQEFKVGQLYCNMFFVFVLQGYLNIREVEQDLLTYENYDKLYPLFFNRTINLFKEDYEQCTLILRDALNLYSIRDLAQSVFLMDQDSLERNFKANEELLYKLENNTILIDDLKEMMAFNDPQLSDAIKKAIVPDKDKVEQLLKESKD